jgi:hypothetical protein
MYNVNLKRTEQADNTIETPLGLCKFISELASSVMTPQRILDPCSGNGNLTHFFPDCEVLSFEIQKGTDFFNCTKDDCKDVDLVLCNPPFNGHKSKKLYPELFLKHILEVTPTNTPIIFITPIGLRLNVRGNSSRLKFLTKLNIHSIVSLPVNVFPQAQVHSEILILNMPRIGKSHYTYHPDTTITKLPTNFKSLSGKQIEPNQLDQAYLKVTNTLTGALGLQKQSGRLLCALINKVDSDGCITINAKTRDDLAIILDTNEQVITNNIKSLSDSNLLIKKARGYYFYSLCDVDDCKLITSQTYASLSVEIKYFKGDKTPKISLFIE